MSPQQVYSQHDLWMVFDRPDWRIVTLRKNHGLLLYQERLAASNRYYSRMVKAENAANGIRGLVSAYGQGYSEGHSAGCDNGYDEGYGDARYDR